MGFGMSQIGEARRVGRLMGDISSIQNGVPASAGRVKHRVLGKASGRALVSFNIVGLIFWTEFMVWLRNAVLQENLEEVWVGSVASYAPLYEYGQFDEETHGGSPRLTGGVATGGHRQVMMLKKAVERVMDAQRSSNVSAPRGDLRSGIYQGSQFVSDAQSIVTGDLPSRIVRRAAGRATSAFFLGTLSNPDLNYFDILADQTLVEVRKIIREEDLIDTGALLASFQKGYSMNEMEQKSVQAMAGALSDAGFLGQLGKRVGKIG